MIIADDDERTQPKNDPRAQSLFWAKLVAWLKRKKGQLIFLRELAGVCALLAMIMTGLTYLSDDDAPRVERTTASAPPPAPIITDVLPPRADAPAEITTPIAQTSAELPPTAEEKVSTDAQPSDPIADPLWFDQLDAIAEFNKIIAYVPSEVDWLPRPHDIRTTPSQKNHIVVDKIAHTLTLFRSNEFVRQFDIAVGKGHGNKSRSGDFRTPEGTFPVVQFHDASSWVHDFGDGKGIIEGAYGPIFIRLDTTPWRGIGIHGTHDPKSIGTDATEGCIRMHNDELVELTNMIDLDTTVTILPN